jgi:hypothetical protein
MRAMRIAALLGGVGCLLVFAASAGAGGPGHTVTETVNVHGTFDDTEGFNPCTDATVTSHFDGNLVTHVTFFPGEDEVWATFTETGRVTFSDGGVDWSGHATLWGNFNQNETNGNATFTIVLDLTASDGSVAAAHDTNHVLWNGVQDPEDPNAVLKLAFDKLVIRELSCAS